MHQCLCDVSGPGDEEAGCWDQRSHLIERKTDLPSWFTGCLTMLFLIWSNGNYSCCAPTHWLSYGVNMRFSALQWGEWGHLDTCRSVTWQWSHRHVWWWPMSALYWYLWSERSCDKTRDATTGVHVMFQTMPMVNVMFSQSLICCFKNHRTRNITALSILCGCFPNGLSSAGHRRALWW